MEQLHLLHSCPFPEEFPLQPAFDEALYLWEQSYFAEHFLGAHLGLETASFLNHPALKEQAQFLAALPECPIHRDSQSQNVHIHAGKTWLIDFQGMRGDVRNMIWLPWSMTATPVWNRNKRMNCSGSGKISPLTP